MTCKLFSSCAGVVLATLMALSCSPARAQTETITFTDLSEGIYVPNGYENLFWGNFGTQPYPGYPFPDGGYTINGDESAFSTEDDPIALISISLTSMYRTGENVQIWGYGPPPNGYTPSQLIDDYNNDGGVNVSPGVTTTLDLDWTGLQYVALNPRGGTDIGQYPGPNGGSTGDVVITSMTVNLDNVIPAPEPPAVVLFGIGALGMARIAMKRRRCRSFAG